MPGYVYVDDLRGKAAANPEEAVRLMKERVGADGRILVPVYAADGTTRIGVFTSGSVEEIRR